MSDNIAIKVDHVSKTFKLPHEKQSSLKGALINLVGGGKRSYERQQALEDISFEVKDGEFFGIVGRNGSGKSTLLKMLAGIYMPTSGTIQVIGKLTPFIELGVGFNPELTGRENVYLNGALLGFGRAQMKAMYENIVSFAELERFMDQKLKNYSSGMQVRLAFSIAIRANSGILLLDEVLAVGDATFQQKCFDYFKELKRQHKTVVLVSHDSGILRQYCTKGILIEKGLITYEGPIDHVVNRYQDSLVEAEKNMITQRTDESEKRWGNQKITVQTTRVIGIHGKEQALFTDADTSILVAVDYKAADAVEQPIFGITINDATGLQIFASNTGWAHIKVTDMVAGDAQRITWIVPNIFNTGSYTISPAVSDMRGAVIYDWREGLTNFKIRKKFENSSLTNIPHDITVTKQKGV